MNEATTHLSREIDFNALSEGQRRTLIATDALAQLHAGKFKATQGKYINADIPRGTACGEATLVEAIQSADGACQVCALGSIFTAALTRTRSTLSLKELRSMNDIIFLPASNVSDTKQFQLGDGALRREMRTYFSREQLGLMETAFECSTSHYFRECETEDESVSAVAESAAEFGRQYHTSYERLEAILQNVIDHCGVFTVDEPK